MREASPRRAFVASTQRDLAEHREYVIEVLRNAGLHVDPMENWTADPAQPLQLSTDRVRECDLCVLLVGHRIGHVPKGHKHSITQQEYDAAKRAGLDVLVFMQDLDMAGQSSKRGRSTRIQDWRVDLTEAHTVGVFDSRPDSVPLASALSRWLQKAAPSDRLALRLPEVPSPRFIGREAMLADLREDVTQSDAAPLIHVLAGMGGAGKSEIALQYAHRYSERYSIVWWIRAETEAGAREDLAALAEELGLVHEERHDVAAAAELARSWLEQHGGWLAVFDNALSPSRLKGLLPTAGFGHVLVTSRDVVWGRIAIVREVGPLERADAVAFLQDAAGGVVAETAEALAEELGDLPLALEQARGLVEATGIDLEAYLTLYRKNRTRLLQERLDDGPYPHTVATTWSMSIERLTSEAPNASSLLEAVSLLAPDPVPLALFAKPEQVDDEPDWDESEGDGAEDLAWDAFDLPIAQAAIRKYSLARVADATVTMHRLVQVVVQDGLEMDRRRELLDALVRAMLRIIRKEGPLPLGEEAWTGHLQALLSRARAEGRVGVALSDLSDIHGVMLRDAGRLEDAQVEFDAAVAARPQEARSDPEAIPLLVHRAHLNAILHDREDGLAELAHLGSRVEALVSTDPHGAMVQFRNLASAYRELGAYASYRDAADRAVEIARATLDPDDIGIVDYIYDSASANHNGREGEDPESLQLARSLHEEGIEISQRLAGPRDPSIVSNLACLGDVLKDLGEIGQGIALREQALEIVEEHYGASSADCAGVLVHLSRMYTVAGRHEDAVNSARRAVAIHEVSGTRLMEAVWAYITLSQCSRSQQRADGWSLGAEGLGEAVAAATAAVNRLTDALGDAHRRLLPALNELAWALVESGASDEARAVAEKMRTIAAADDDVDIGWEVSAYQVMADTWWQVDELDRALEALQAGLALLPPGPGRLRETFCNRASSLLRRRALEACELGRYDEALADHEQSLLFGEGMEEEALAWTALGFTLVRLGEIVRADEAARRIEAIYEVASDVTPWERSGLNKLLGFLAGAQGEHDRAVEYIGIANSRQWEPSGRPCDWVGCDEPGLDWGNESVCPVHLARRELVRFEGERALTLLLQGPEADAIDSFAESLARWEGLGTETCSGQLPAESGVLRFCEEPSLEGSTLCARHAARRRLGVLEASRAERLLDSGYGDQALEAMSRAVVMSRHLGNESCCEPTCSETGLQVSSGLCTRHEAERRLQEHAMFTGYSRV